MNTIQTVAQAIAEACGDNAQHVAEVLSGQSNDGADYFQELDRLAADAATPTEVVWAIDGYAYANVDVHTRQFLDAMAAFIDEVGESDEYTDPLVYISLVARKNLRSRRFD